MLVPTPQDQRDIGLDRPSDPKPPEKGTRTLIEPIASSVTNTPEPTPAQGSHKPGGVMLVSLKLDPAPKLDPTTASDLYRTVARATDSSSVIKEGLEAVRLKYVTSSLISTVGAIFGAALLSSVELSGAQQGIAATTIGMLKPAIQIAVSALGGLSFLNLIMLSMVPAKSIAVASPKELVEAHRARHLEKELPSAIVRYLSVALTSPDLAAKTRASLTIVSMLSEVKNPANELIVLSNFFVPLPGYKEVKLKIARVPTLAYRICEYIAKRMHATRFDLDCFNEDQTQHNMINSSSIVMLKACIKSGLDIAPAKRDALARMLNEVAVGIEGRLPQPQQELFNLATAIRKLR